MSATTNQSAAVRAKSALRRQRRILLIAAIVTAVLIAGLVLTAFLTRRTAFYDPKDGTKYYVAPKDGAYVLMTTDGETLRTTESRNFVTAAGTIVNVDKTTGQHTIVATVLTEGSESTYFNSGSDSYDVLLYPILERADIAAIRVVNGDEKFGMNRVVNSEGEIEFVLESRPDLVVSESTLFATLVYCTGYTRTLMRLDPDAVAAHGYAEYGLPAAGEEPKRYFEIVDTEGTTHRVILGDEIPSGAGYYAKYADRDAVYVLRELSASDYNSTFAKALFGREEDYVEVRNVSHNMTSNNYFDVTNFRIYHGDAPDTPFIDFSYSGSIDKRANTFYTSVPYVATGTLAGYGINNFTVDEALYSLLELKPEFVVALGNSDRGYDINTWLKQYGLDSDSYAHRLSFILNLTRSYDKENDRDIISKETDTEMHEIFISEKQEDGYIYMYNIGYLWDPETGTYAKLADGYDMVVAVKPAALDFLNWEQYEWINHNIFSGNIAYITEMSFQIPSGNSTFPEGFSKIFYLDNSEAMKNSPTTNTISSTGLVVRDSTGKSIDVPQFRLFYQTLLSSNLGGISSLDSEKKDALHQGTGGEPILSISIKFVLTKYNSEAGAYEPTGEIVTREYHFYRDVNFPSEIFVSLNGNGDFFMRRARVEKIISDLNKVYTGETIRPHDTY